MKCEVCGHIVQDNDLFCQDCGNKIERIDFTEQALNEKQKKKKKIVLWIASISIIVLVIIAAGVFLFCSIFNGPVEGVRKDLIIAKSEDTVFLARSGEIIEITDIYDNLFYSEYVVAVDENTIYALKDIEYDNDLDEHIGKLIRVNSKGEATEIDDDVVAGLFNVARSTLWYAKADRDEYVIYSVSKGNPRQVSDGIEDLKRIMGLSNGRNSYFYADDYIGYASRENSDELMDDIDYCNGIGRDEKYVIVLTDSEELVFVNNKENIEIYDEVHYFIICENNRDAAVVTYDDELYFIPFGKNDVLIDEDVDNLIHAYDGSNGFKPALVDIFYTDNDGDLYIFDPRKPSEGSEKIFRDYYYPYYIMVYDDHIIHLEDDEMTKVNLGNLKEQEFSFDTDDIESDLYLYNGKHIIYLNSDNELVISTDGEDDVLLVKDPDDMKRLYFIENGRKIVWQDDDELLISSLNGRDQDKAYRNVKSFRVIGDKEIYLLADYDESGDFVFVQTNGKSEVLAKDIISLSYIYYIK